MSLVTMFEALIVLGMLSFVVWAVKTLLFAGLHEAVKADKYDTVLRLLNAGRSVNALSPHHDIYGGYTPLHLVRTARVAKLLLGHGADPNALDVNGCTPLHSKSRDYVSGKVPFGVIEILIQAGAKAGISSNENDPKWVESALTKAGRLDLIEQLISNGSRLSEDMSAKYSDGNFIVPGQEKRGSSDSEDEAQHLLVANQSRFEMLQGIAYLILAALALVAVYFLVRHDTF
jgi:hypothetical protein